MKGMRALGLSGLRTSTLCPASGAAKCCEYVVSPWNGIFVGEARRRGGSVGFGVGATKSPRYELRGTPGGTGPTGSNH